MKENFWETLEHFFALAPMEDVTDTVFRELVLRNSSGKNLKVLFTEFLSTDGFCHPIGRGKVIHRFNVNESEKLMLKNKDAIVVAQIWGTDPEKFYKTAKYINDYTGFSGVDINMGCPQKNIIKKGACSALINDPELAKEIICATAEASEVPVSVKTRIGFKNIETDRWIPHLLESPIKALTVHGRIQKQMSDGIANWDEIAKVVKLRDEINPFIKIIGNGDVTSVAEGKEKMKSYNVDGIMVGRGIFSDFWMFSEKQELGVHEKLRAINEHARLYHNTWSGNKPWQILKRFFKIYTYNLPQASQLRDAIMKTNNIDDLNLVLDDYQSKVVKNQ
ncbi:tRNA-dihydrouridine synthase [Labilibacter sediminis]|nr:tRNA-dihydrouridine synthase [Labilibacter sediminis]